MINSNPLLNKNLLPKFSQIKPEHILPAIKLLLDQSNKTLEKLLDQKDQNYSWENFLQPLDEMHNQVDFAWSTINHLNGVKNSADLRHAYDQALPLVTEYFAKLGQNFELFQAIKSIRENKNFDKLDIAQKKAITNELRDFHLAGVDLPPKEKKLFLQLQQKIAALGNKFSNNVLDATQKWKYLASQSEITGIPEHALAIAKSKAFEKNQTGWLFTLDFPSYYAVITFADSRSFREKIYYAYITRASELNKKERKLDNTIVMHEILRLKKQIASMLGFKNYAEFSLATKMAKTPKEVLDFLNKLTKYSLKKGKSEFIELSKFAKEKYGCDKLAPWDIAYYSEKLREAKYNVSEEEIREYFPVDHVINGMFYITNKIFKVTFKEVKKFNSWHKDARLFEIYDQNRKLRGKFFVDLFARKDKRSGAWMSQCRNRMQLANGTIQLPVAYLNCNFTPSCKSKPSLLTHTEIDTLFHEFGHCLQHLLTKINYVKVSGINGIPIDAVEFPSQFMENFCWGNKALNILSCHYKTKQKLPKTLCEKMLKAKNFQSGLLMLRQLEFALFDFHLHLEFNPQKKNQIQQIINKVRQKVSVIPVAKFNRMQHSFNHIFSYGYCAGYYSYKWAEVLANDAFNEFVKNGIFSSKIGSSFLHNILEVGGSIEPLQAFENFCKRKPDVQSLLKSSDIIK